MRELDLNDCCPKERRSLFAFWKKVRFEGGERENDLWVLALLNQLSFFLVFFSFLFYFLSYLFLFFLLYFFLLLLKICSVFYPPVTGHGKGLFIAPAVASVLPSYPLTAFVWFGCTCRPPGLCDIHPRQTEAGLFCSSVFLPRY